METCREIAGSPTTITPDSSSPLMEAASKLYTLTPVVDEDTALSEQLHWYCAPTPD